MRLHDDHASSNHLNGRYGQFQIRLRPKRSDDEGRTIQAYVGLVKSPTLEIRKLGPHDRGRVGLWTGNNSDGDFANLRIIQMK